MDHKISKLLGKPTLEGQVGESHVWDGPSRYHWLSNG